MGGLQKILIQNLFLIPVNSNIDYTDTWIECHFVARCLYVGTYLFNSV